MKVKFLIYHRIRFSKIFLCLLVFSITSPFNLFAQLAAGHNKFFGNVYGNSNIHPTFLTYWNQVTPENRGKWIYNEPGRDVYSWDGLDAAYNYANQNYLSFKDHTLIWGTSQGEPFWIQSLSLTEQAEEVEEWIQLVAQRYPYMDMVDVVNEPLHEYPVFADALGGSGTSGWDWVIWSFQKARLYFSPYTKLIINEYNIVNNSSNTSQLINIVNLLQSDDLIDGIGVQAHYFSLRFTSTNVITNNLNQLAATGLPIYVSEMEIDVADDNEQLQEMQRVFPVLWEHPGVKGITYWGYIQGQMWKQDGYLLRSDGTERPALQWLRTYLSETDIKNEINIPPTNYTLHQNYPNPFNPTTTIIYSLPKSSEVSLTIFDIRGKQIRNLVNAFQSIGEHSVVWDATDDQSKPVASGIYFYRLKTDQSNLEKRMLLIR